MCLGITVPIVEMTPPGTTTGRPKHFSKKVILWDPAGIFLLPPSLLCKCVSTELRCKKVVSHFSHKLSKLPSPKLKPSYKIVPHNPSDLQYNV